MEYLIAIISVSYFAVLAWVTVQWRRIPAHFPESASEHPFVSVIIPFRNEAGNLKGLFESLSSQSYPGQLEFILIDDHSTDSSFAFAEAWVENNTDKRIKLISLKGETLGKKAAIECGVNKAKGSVILATDADTRLPSLWVREMTRALMFLKTSSVTGPVEFVGNGFLHRLQQLEMNIVQGISAVCWERGIPAMGSAANLAYFKNDFIQLKPYDGNRDLPTGDDEFLLGKLSVEGNGNRFVKSAAATVLTPSAEGFSAFLSQRRRWASKWKRGNVPYLSLAVLFINLFFISLPILTITDIISIQALLLSFGLKCLSELLFAYHIRVSLQLGTPVSEVILVSIIYPFYAVIIGILSNFGSYSWKGRDYHL